MSTKLRPISLEEMQTFDITQKSRFADIRQEVLNAIHCWPEGSPAMGFDAPEDKKEARAIVNSRWSLIRSRKLGYRVRYSSTRHIIMVVPGKRTYIKRQPKVLENV